MTEPSNDDEDLKPLVQDILAKLVQHDATLAAHSRELEILRTPGG